MQNLRIIIIAVLVAGCLFHVEGFPTDKESDKPQPAGYFETVKNYASRACNALWCRTGLVSQGAKTVGSGITSGAGSVGSSLASGAGSVGSSLASGAGNVGSSLASGAGSVGSSLATGAGAVGGGLVTGAGAVGGGLVTGASVVGSGIATGASVVGSGLTVGMNGIVTGLGAGAHFTLNGLSKALSAVNPQTLTAALGLPDLSKALAENVDIYSILPKLIIGQAQTPEQGVMNYETATIFLEKLVVLVPQLKRTVDAYKTVSYVMNEYKEMKGNEETIDSAAVMKKAVNLYFSDVDDAFKQKMIDLAPVVYEAAFGDTEAAWKVAGALAERDTVIQALKGMGFKNQLELIQTVIAEVSKYAQLVKTTAAAANKMAS